MLTYSVHRIIGFSNLEDKFIEGRFKIIKKFKFHIFTYALISFLITVILLARLPQGLLLFLVLPALISALYTIPILSKKKRLRDFNYLKIVLIALTWASVAYADIWSQAFSNHISLSLFALGEWILIGLFIEKVIYILAITLPFDIRDETIDKHSNVKTFPSLWGHENTYKVIYLLLLLSAILFLTIYISLFGYQPMAIAAIILAYGLSYWAVRKSKGKRSDLYYSGMLDGVIILRSVLIIGGCYLAAI
jgi:4-hydroxybenzoate polyprenyltransferase